MPNDKSIAEEYASKATATLENEIKKGFSAVVPPDADVNSVAEAIVKVVNTPFGQRPFRTHIDPAQDGSEVVSVVADHIRADIYAE